MKVRTQNERGVLAVGRLQVMRSNLPIISEPK
jgi:hypothetical protein